MANAIRRTTVTQSSPTTNHTPFRPFIRMGGNHVFPHRFTSKRSPVAQSSKGYWVACSRCLAMLPHGLVRRRSPMAFHVARHELSISFLHLEPCSAPNRVLGWAPFVTKQCSLQPPNLDRFLWREDIQRSISWEIGAFGALSNQCDCLHPRAENPIPVTLPICNHDLRVVIS